ncbi:hypothetical protein HWV62_19567 [Athelia sp. TMB]|nr:hypothetical protein HWV62_19567 [Athelia sp. TMB]
MPPHVDLVIVFKTTTITLSKQQAREDAAKAEQQYSKLLTTLKQAGFLATGRRGQKDGELVILVSSPPRTLASLVHRERHSDFLSGLPTSSILEATKSFEDGPLSAAERIRLIHSHIVSLPQDGGLGIAPQSDDWKYVDSIMPLHDSQFNHAWLKVWTTTQFSSTKVDAVREQFGDSVALYFTFLSTYFKALIFPAIVGAGFWYLGQPYSPIYSAILVGWSVTFVEYWRIRERVLGLRWGTSGSLKVERYRPDFTPGVPWWKKELRVLASVPVTILFTGLLGCLMTGIFMLEAFVSMLYTGPAHMVLQTLSPAILFTLLVPRVLRSHLARAKSFTAWENHAHQSSYESSLAIKTFTLSACVSYFNLILSAIVYVPFGDNITGWVQQQIYTGGSLIARDVPVTAEFIDEKEVVGVWNLTDVEKARSRLNPKRLQEQMFAFMVTNQVINTLTEVVVPYVIRKVKEYKAEKADKAAGGDGKKKKVAFEDEVKGGTESDMETKEDREFLEKVRLESARPVYDVFGDYNEMVTQFGYVVMWSAIWPLAGVAALINNLIEIRSDAFKVTNLTRRPIPLRTDTIGPWLESLTFITWFAAVTNAALVYLYDGSSHDGATTALLVPSAATDGAAVTASTLDIAIKRQLLFKAALIALGASHGFIIVRGVIKHILEMMFWKGSPELHQAEINAKEVKAKYLNSVDSAVSEKGVASGEVAPIEEEGAKTFWSYDEGLDEIRKAAKDA